MAVGGWSSGAANINGRFLPIEEAAIPITDWGCRRSNATYDVVAVWRGAFFRLDDHLKRFRNSMRALRLDPPETDDTIRRVLAECVRRAGLREAYIAMDCLRSSPMPGQARHPASCRNLTAFVIPWMWVVSPDVQARGAHLAVAKTPRIADASVDPRVKNFHWGDFTRGLFEAYDHGADNGVLLDSDGNATEGPGFNVFAVIDGTVATPLSRRARRHHTALVEKFATVSGFHSRSAPCRRSGYGWPTKFSGRRWQVASYRLGASTRVSLATTWPGPISSRLREALWAKRAEGWHATPGDYEARETDA
jgi:branched-chain amino acid aminotransferase